MALVKILGAIDLISGLAFLMLVFGADVFVQFILFCVGLLLLKGMFIFTGDVLSVIDIFSSIVLLLSLLFTIPTFLLWMGAFFLIAKGFASFL